MYQSSEIIDIYFHICLTFFIKTTLYTDLYEQIGFFDDRRHRSSIGRLL